MFGDYAEGFADGVDAHVKSLRAVGLLTDAAPDGDAE
jgi:hypothetical protein